MVFDLVGQQEAKRIASKAEIETVDTYRDNLDYYREKNFSYIPLPADKKYYDVDKGELRDLSDEQLLRDDVHLVWAMALLLDYPFVLLDFHGLHSDRSDLAERFGIQRDESERYRIITLADLDTRSVKIMLYPAVATFEHELADAVRGFFPDSDIPDEVVREKVRERWEDALEKDVETHIVEHMHLTDLKEVIRETEELRLRCGLDSKNKVDNIGGLIQLRHQVMHPPRPMIDDREDLDSVLDRLSRIKMILDNLRNSTE